MASCTQVESLIQAYLDSELTPSERVVFDQHLSECTACAKQLSLHQANSAMLIEVLSVNRLRHSLRDNVIAHLPEMDHPHRTPRPTPVWKTKKAPIRFQWLRMFAPALAIVMVCVLALTLFYSWPLDEANSGRSIGMVTHRLGDVMRSTGDSTQRYKVALRNDIYAKQRFETGDTGTLMVTLAGPTLVKADANTRFLVHDYRKISLEKGHLWFNVAKDSRTFRVETPSGVVTVFGTTFDVDVKMSVGIQPDYTTVTVSEGEVQVENDITFAPLRPGEQIDIVSARTVLKPRPVNVERVMAWAERIQPETVVEPRLLASAETLSGKDNGLWDEQTLVVDVHDKTVRSLILRWAPSQSVTGDHSGYTVYVYDNRLQHMFKQYIAGHIFDHDDDNFYVMTLPETQTVSNVGALRIQLVPDRTGTLATTFLELAAME